MPRFWELGLHRKNVGGYNSATNTQYGPFLLGKPTPKHAQSHANGSRAAHCHRGYFNETLQKKSGGTWPRTSEPTPRRPLSPGNGAPTGLSHRSKNLLPLLITAPRDVPAPRGVALTAECLCQLSWQSGYQGFTKGDYRNSHRAEGALSTSRTLPFQRRFLPASREAEGNSPGPTLFCLDWVFQTRASRNGSEALGMLGRREWHPGPVCHLPGAGTPWASRNLHGLAGTRHKSCGQLPGATREARTRFCLRALLGPEAKGLRV